MDNGIQKVINRGAKTYMIRSVIAPILMAVLYFAAAGSMNNHYAWIYFILFFVLSVSANGFFYINHRDLLFHRNSIKSDAKGWDKILMPTAVFSGFHLQSIVMGLDARFNWSYLGHRFSIIGLVIFIISFLFTIWAMYVNRYFEANVRIQHDREHRVISEGPYRFIRHPGYVSFIMTTFSIPLIFGSLYGFINAVISTVLILIRTGMEDQTLKNELDGYADYAQKVKYRILPGFW